MLRHRDMADARVAHRPALKRGEKNRLDSELKRRTPESDARQAKASARTKWSQKRAHWSNPELLEPPVPSVKESSPEHPTLSGEMGNLVLQ